VEAVVVVEVETATLEAATTPVKVVVEVKPRRHSAEGA
jgi:hypothetical protein